MIGKYYIKGKDFNESLIIQKNHTFTLVEQGFEYDSQCQGKWKYISKDTIVLQCDSEKDVEKMLQSDYMSDRLRKATILNRNQIKIKNVVLTKVK